MKSRPVWAFVVSALLVAVVWALSVPVTGMSEPWDAEGPYYVVALAVAGAIAGSIVPKHLVAHYTGAVLGQAAYELLFLQFGALFVLGLAFLAGYSIIFLAAAAIAASLRRGRSNEATRSLAIMPRPALMWDRGTLAWLGSVGIASAVVQAIWPLTTWFWGLGVALVLWSMKDHPIRLGTGFSSWRMSFNRVEALLFSTGIVLIVVPMLFVIAESWLFARA